VGPESVDFTLTITGTSGHYTIEASGPSGIAVPPQPFGEDYLTAQAAALTKIFASETLERDELETLGSAFYDALFPRQVARAFSRSYSELTPNAHLRLRLVIRPPELNILPWELVYDPDQQFFLAARQTYPVVRFFEGDTPSTNQPVPRPLQVLYVTAQPSDLPPLDVSLSQAALQSALGRQAEVTVLSEATPARLREALRQPRFHILHFDGHAWFDPDQHQGFLGLQDEQGQSQPLSGEMLASYMAGSDVRLAVLAACESGMDAGDRRYSGIAYQLMKASGLPAVVAMQFRIPDESAITFTQGLYSALADNLPVDEAVAQGRLAILETLGSQPFNSPAWGTPVLFLRTPDGNVLRPKSDTSDGDRAAGAIGELSGMTRVSPHMREAAARFSSLFMVACKQVDLMGDFKDLHDRLHQIQIQCFDTIVRDEKRFPQPDVLEAYDLYQSELRKKLLSIQSIGERGRVQMDIQNWYPDLAQADQDLEQAINQSDPRLLRHAKRKLADVLETQPVAINQSLINTARQLPSKELLAALSELEKDMEPLLGNEIKDEQYGNFCTGVQELQAMFVQLDGLLNEHNLLQFVNWKLQHIRVQIEQDLLELQDSWDDVRERATPLYVGRSEIWALELQQKGHALDESLLAANTNEPRRAFGRYAYAISERFFKVDVDLKSLCEQLRKIGEPLAELIRSLNRE
jgi:hypothetical protein